MIKNILIVEDSQIVLERLRNKINSISRTFKTEHAGTKKAALTTITAKQPDIVILDIQLPDGSGIDILAKIKKDNPKTLVIVLTNFPYSLIRRRCMELGADFFFDKSTEFGKVFDVFSSII
jgi:DNA-binding NarL/FixJ family response regulator